MASLDNDDPDLEALRSAVLATIKLKNCSDSLNKGQVTRTDSELEELRKAALKSTKKQNETLVKQSPPTVEFGLKRHNRNANLIVIQPLNSENEKVKTESSFAHKLLRPQDAYCRLKGDETSRPLQQQQQRVKGTDKFSRFVSSSSSSEDESDYYESDWGASEKASQTSENKSVGDLEERTENVDDDNDVLVLQPNETFDENIEKLDEQPSCKNGERKAEETKDLNSEKDERTLNKKSVETERKQDRLSERVNEDSKSDRSKRRHRDETDRSLHRKHRKHEREEHDSVGERRQHRKTREQRNEERKKEKSETVLRNKGDDGRVKLNSILSKAGSGERTRSTRTGGSTRSKSLEKNSKVGELLDLREKLKSRKRTGNELKDEEDNEEDEQVEVKRKSRGVSEERRKKSRSKSKSPPIKSVLSVVKLTSAVVDSSVNRKRTAETIAVNSPPKSNDSVNSQRTNSSPIRCDPSPERKVLIRSRHTHNYASEANDDVQRDSRIHITVTEESVRNTDSNGPDSQSPKPKLPVHLRLGNLPTASNNNQPHSLQVHISDKKRKSVSPSKPSDTSSSAKSIGGGGAGSDRKTLSRQVLKLSGGDRVRSIATILSKHSTSSDRLSTNKMQQLTGKTFENELDEKIRRIRVNNLAIMKRKSEIEREQHSNG